MALGSSAPEILLSVIEILSNNFFSGDLGPSTIVGSAAFNLFCISAVCVAAIPNNEIRMIKDTNVFFITASFSIIAYLWLYTIVTVTTPDEVNILEGAATFLFFPVLVGLAFCADKGYFSAEDPEDEGLPAADRQSKVLDQDLSKEELAAMEMSLKKTHGLALTDEQLAELIGKQTAQPKSKATYRVAAIRSIVGGKRVGGNLKEKVRNSMASVVPIAEPKDKLESGPPKMAACHVGLSAKNYAILESAGVLNLSVVRTGDLTIPLAVDYRCRDGVAKAGEDYEAVEGTLKFEIGEKEKMIHVKIINDNANENDEDFYVELFEPRCPGREHEVHMELGEVDVARILIVDDDMPGVLSFEKEAVEVHEEVGDKQISVTVLRKDGSNGTVSCKYCTEDGTATEGSDYKKAEGTLTFAHGQLSAEIPLTICGKGRYESTEEFRLILTDAAGGVKFDKSTDGSSESCILTVIIIPDDESKGQVDRVMRLMSINWHKTQLGHANWKDQFRDAFLVNGGDEEAGAPSAFDWAMHIITVFWKVLFATIPPTDYCGGWLCFFCALGLIGAVTALIGDLAALAGCVLGIPDSITAISLVALGTSLPDTFASKAAAEQDPYADASIGNVTGSNSVNVFLGLGLPWTIGSIYWAIAGRTAEWQERYKSETDFNMWNTGGGKFIVIGGDLGYSVIIFSAGAMSALAILFIRRKLFGGELGGPTIPKYVTSLLLVLIWLTYVCLSAVKTMSKESTC
eukprot:TRINITY_DN24944_c0_g1_i1.p1 TRINITY_DN24944_c0_g1~~TRINITY_DN24944_c0_g1_i1.p1  ORF type:complete len:820 (-),score=142.40 TRINITY_DN24944_c0_g1_i1:59-2287(-)